MRLTEDVINKIAVLMQHTKMNGEINWKDGDEIDVCLAGTYAADKFIVIHNRTKNPVVSTAPHPDFDYDKQEWKDGRSAGYNK